ncbi:MAG: hypothetical protein ABI725_02290 [Chloroflexota bacterium]
MSMRIRSIKPAYWSDHSLHTQLTAPEREFYIGLWQQADDAGWLRWQVHRIGAELYPFQSVRKREAFIQAAAEHLSTLEPDAPHLIIHDCGHAQVPKMPGHQHRASKPVFTFKIDHDTRCLPRPSAHFPGFTRNPAPDREVKDGEVKDGEVRRGNGSLDPKRRSGQPQSIGELLPPPPGYKQ